MVAAAFLAACGSSADTVESVVLDQPGEYQEPTIALNQDLRGKPFRTAVVLDRNDASVDVAALIDRPLVVNFWFSACPPCKREMPALQSVHESYIDRVRFVGVNPIDSRDRMNEFASSMGVTYELLRDVDGELLVANGISAFPTTLFVATDGSVIRQIAGELTVGDLTAAIEELLA